VATCKQRTIRSELQRHGWESWELDSCCGYFRSSDNGLVDGRSWISSAFSLVRVARRTEGYKALLLTLFFVIVDVVLFGVVETGLFIWITRLMVLLPYNDDTALACSASTNLEVSGSLAVSRKSWAH
jgi:hypothetical protein